MLTKRKALDFRPDGWSVRDQGARGTCVAHALAACREHRTVTSGAPEDLSEQFLFWAAKTLGGDPHPDDDGTRLEFAAAALSGHGLCPESVWPYNPRVRGKNVTHAGKKTPSAAARQSANPYATAASHHAGGNAAHLYDALARTGCPVAISLPVFADWQDNRRDQWNTVLAVLYGSVFDPPYNSVVVGGHAVCVTGFVPDMNEAMGGYFIFRNSWGTSWAHKAPAPQESHSPGPGYGQVSASYIDDFVWEMCSLG